MAKLVAWTTGEIQRALIGASRRCPNVGQGIEILLLGKDARQRSVTRALKILGVTVLACCTLLSDAQAQPQPSSEPEKLPSFIGKPAPPFTLTTLAGKQVSLADFKGKALIVNFWATWCGACRLEMPWLAQLREKYEGRGFEIIGVVTDAATEEKVRQIAGKYDVKYPIVRCNHKTAQAYGGLPELPESFYIDQTGKVVLTAADAGSRDEVEANIRKLLELGAK
jgi:thiol-disulfide isomerase/thioredoxin